MLRKSGLSAGFVILFIAALALAQQGHPTLTARELFYEAVPAPPKAPKKPAPAPSGAPVVPAAAAGPFGIRYSIVRLVSGSKDPVETSPEYIFHSGDHIQIKVQPNSAGYLYVVQDGTSGEWAPIFPSPQVDGGDNRVEGWHIYTLPTPEYQMSFDKRTGTENVLILFSRQPVPDFETLIYSLKDHALLASPRAAAAPQPKVMLTTVKINDDTVGRLRNSSSRDLVVEPVDSGTPPRSSGDKKETAVYVVSRAGSPNSRLVADLHLVHR